MTVVMLHKCKCQEITSKIHWVVKSYIRLLIQWSDGSCTLKCWKHRTYSPKKLSINHSKHYVWLRCVYHEIYICYGLKCVQDKWLTNLFFFLLLTLKGLKLWWRITQRNGYTQLCVLVYGTDLKTKITDNVTDANFWPTLHRPHKIGHHSLKRNV